MTRLLPHRLLLGLCLCLLGATCSHAELLINEDPEETGGGIEVPGPEGAPVEGTPAQARDAKEILIFANGDSLHGELQTVSDQGGIVWNRDDVAKPMTFTPENLMGMRLRRGYMPGLSRDFSRVELTNGDTLFGQVVSLNDQHLELSTPYGGILKIQRRMIRTLFPGRTSEPALFVGPGRLEDWTLDGTNNWSIKGGKLTAATGRIGRDVKLPDVAHISMDVDWKGRYPTFMLSLYSTSPQNPNDCYNLSINNSTIYLNRNSSQTGNQNLGHHNLQEIMQMERMHMEIFVNKADRSLYLFLDGKMVKQWKDPQEFNTSGTNMIIYAHDNNVTMQFSNLRVAKWDGKFPNESKAESGDEDMVELANEDRMHGALKSIENGSCVFVTKFAPKLDIPLDRIIRINMSKEHEQRARRNPGDVELYFATGEHLTVQLKDLSDRTLTGWNEALGDVQLKTDAFVGMRLNLYKSTKDEEAQGEQIGAMQDLIFH